MPEQKFTTSFIPKKPIQTVGSGGRIKRKGGAGLFTIISVIIFLIAMATTAGAYIYEFKLQADIEEQNNNLANATKELDQQFISEAVRLNNRLAGVEDLLEEHISPSQIFALLEEKTVSSVRFESLDFSYGDNGDLLLSGRGVSADFESIIQQSDEYGGSRKLRDVIFSNLQNEERGLVSFDFESTVDPEVILYSNTLLGSDSTLSDEEDFTADQNDSPPESQSSRPEGGPPSGPSGGPPSSQTNQEDSSDTSGTDSTDDDAVDDTNDTNDTDNTDNTGDTDETTEEGGETGDDQSVTDDTQ